MESGKRHCVPIACSHNPVLALTMLSDIEPSIDVLELENHIESVVTSIISSPKTVDNLVSFEHLLQMASSDQDYQMVKKVVSTGFAKSRGNLEPILRLFWDARNRLLLSKDGLLLMDNRVIVPSNIRSQVLNDLHSAQGVKA